MGTTKSINTLFIVAWRRITTYLFVFGITFFATTAHGTNESYKTGRIADALTVEDLDFSLHASCSDYWGLTSTDLNWFRTYGDQASGFEVWIADDAGKPVSLVTRKNNGGLYSLITWDNSSWTPEKLREIVRANVDKNLLLKCIHMNTLTGEAQTFNMFVPLKVREAWRGNPVYPKDNFNYLEVSHLTDLHFRLYEKFYTATKNYATAYQMATAAMQFTFPDGIVTEIDPRAYPGIYLNAAPIRYAGTAQNAHYTLLRKLANTYTGGKVDLLNKVIANQMQAFYLSGKPTCQPTPWVCGAFFPDSYQTLNTNPRFYDGLLGWTQSQQLEGSANGYISASMVSEDGKNDVSLSLQTNHGNSLPRSQIDMFQVISITPADIDQIYVVFKGKSASGKCTAFGGCFSSGFAGYYACLHDQNDTQLGCIIPGTYTDTIQLPILVGEWFKVESTTSLRFEELATGRFSQIFNLRRAIDLYLPDVRNNLNSIAKISIGVVTSEMFSKLSDTCLSCSASLVVEELAVRRLIY